MIDILAAIRSWANAISDRSCSAAARYFFAGSRGSSAANATGKRADFAFTVASRNPICGHGLRCFRPSKRILMDQLQEANRWMQPPLLGIGRNYFQCLGTRVSSSSSNETPRNEKPDTKTESGRDDWPQRSLRFGS